jgi:tetratricopeptide (TPR) repeat protein
LPSLRRYANLAVLRRTVCANECVAGIEGQSMSADEISSDLARLRRAASGDPRNGVLRYLLGAELAHLQDYDGALLEFSAAIALDPSLDIARFQLGLLHLTLAQTDHALAVLAPLEDLADDNPLKHFQRGLTALINDDLPAFFRSMQHGIASNTTNQALQRDMQMLLERVAQAIPEPASASMASTSMSSVPPDGEVHTDFSLYGVKH